MYTHTHIYAYKPHLYTIDTFTNTNCIVAGHTKKKYNHAKQDQLEMHDKNAGARKYGDTITENAGHTCKSWKLQQKSILYLFPGVNS